jgi:hypothetical protein
MTMAYDRKTEKPEKLHPIQEDFAMYEQLNLKADPGWIVPHLTELHEDSRFALHRLFSVIDDVTKRDFSEYRPEIATTKKAEAILDARRKFMTFMKKHITKAQKDIEAMERKILQMTQPETINDPTRAMLQELRNQEIRSLVRNTDPKYRHDLIRSNVEFIKALVSSPDEIISKESLTELRREYAFTEDPTLKEEERDTKDLYRYVRKRAGEVNATATVRLLHAKIDDPLPPNELFEVFPPRNDYEKYLTRQKTQKYERAKNEAERKEKFLEENEGINLEVQARKERRINRT